MMKVSADMSNEELLQLTTGLSEAQVQLILSMALRERDFYIEAFASAQYVFPKTVERAKQSLIEHSNVELSHYAVKVR
jgi:hypothetical protein